MVRVKICGITNIEDALASVAAGADMLGFNFYSKSPRYVSPQAAREIVTAVTRVGVFVNETPEVIEDAVAIANLDSVQLHGDFDSSYISAIRNLVSPRVEVIRAFRISQDFSIDLIRDAGADAVLLDAYVAGEAGGTGMTCDWGVAKQAHLIGTNIYLAGGLSADNVGKAIEEVHPFAVDACSLLESIPGRKDHEKVRQFIIEAKRND